MFDLAVVEDENSMSKMNFILLGLLMCCLMFAACYRGGPAFIYGPDITYIDDDHEVANSMRGMSVLIGRLNQTLSSLELQDDEKQKKVIQILSKINDVGDHLRASSLNNHPQMEQNIDAFRRSLRNALEDASDHPPNYYLAGTITGSCSSCHLVRTNKL